MVLTRIYKQQEINQKKLAEKSGKDQATLARILDILQRKGLVERLADKYDRRAYNVILTKKGKDLKEKIAPVIESAYDNILYNISDEHLAIWKEVLLKMSENMDASC